MKNFNRVLAGLAVAATLASCQDLFQGRQSTIHISFQQTIPDTRAQSAIPQIDDFILSVTDAKGEKVYEGRYGDSPDELIVSAGNYTISAVSTTFSEPAYDKPQFGDTQVVVVKAGEDVSVVLSCSQLNSGLRLRVEDKFKDTFPDGVLYLKAAEGSLMHDFGEHRTAYFRPGNVTLTMKEGGTEQTLFTRSLAARQILDMSVSTNLGQTSGGVEIQVDTAREWISGSFIFGDDGAADIDSAYSIEEARDHVGAEGVWVGGYIVGVATNTGRFSFSGPFDRNTNIVLGNKSSTSDGAYCMSVELKSGLVREALNLVDNPSNLGKKVYLKGNIVEAYYGIPGLKGISEFSFN